MAGWGGGHGAGYAGIADVCGGLMAEDNGQRARISPTSGINGTDEAERRATSALLAVMGSVREFGLAMVKPMGAPVGQLDCYIEVPFKAGERTIYPDEIGRASCRERGCKYV